MTLVRFLVMLTDAEYSRSTDSTGLLRPIPASLTGNASIRLSMSDTLLPTSAGISFSLITFSNGWNR